MLAISHCTHTRVKVATIIPIVINNEFCHTSHQVVCDKGSDTCVVPCMAKLLCNIWKLICQPKSVYVYRCGRQVNSESAL